jgi:hypothetical protein
MLTVSGQEIPLLHGKDCFVVDFVCEVGAFTLQLVLR